MLRNETYKAFVTQPPTTFDASPCSYLARQFSDCMDYATIRIKTSPSQCLDLPRMHYREMRMSITRDIVNQVGVVLIWEPLSLFHNQN